MGATQGGALPGSGGAKTTQDVNVVSGEIEEVIYAPGVGFPIRESSALTEELVGTELFNGYSRERAIIDYVFSGMPSHAGTLVVYIRTTDDAGDSFQDIMNLTINGLTDTDVITGEIVRPAFAELTPIVIAYPESPADEISFTRRIPISLGYGKQYQLLTAAYGPLGPGDPPAGDTYPNVGINVTYG